jgi:hypothetical protein
MSRLRFLDKQCGFVSFLSQAMEYILCCGFSHSYKGRIYTYVASYRHALSTPPLCLFIELWNVYAILCDGFPGYVTSSIWMLVNWRPLEFISHSVTFTSCSYPNISHSNSITTKYGRAYNYLGEPKALHRL